jgi:hypothetical protein
MTRKRLKILYVGGESAVYRGLSDLLKGAGYAVTPAGLDGGKGLNAAALATFDVVVQDGFRAEEPRRIVSRKLRRGSRRGAVLTAQPASAQRPHGPSSRVAHKIDKAPSPISLRGLREVAGKTQEEVSRRTSMSQPQLSRMEARRDHLISTVRKYVQALGGEIEVIALMSGARFSLRDV